MDRINKAVKQAREFRHFMPPGQIWSILGGILADKNEEDLALRANIKVLQFDFQPTPVREIKEEHTPKPPLFARMMKTTGFTSA